MCEVSESWPHNTPTAYMVDRGTAGYLLSSLSVKHVSALAGSHASPPNLYTFHVNHLDFQ